MKLEWLELLFSIARCHENVTEPPNAYSTLTNDEHVSKTISTYLAVA